MSKLTKSMFTPDQEKWVQRRAKHYKISRADLRNLILSQNGLCKWSGIPMHFDKKHLHPPTDPVAATLEHNEPNSKEKGYSIVCHYLNDVKGKLPFYLFESLRAARF